MNLQLDQRVALVTGASKGLGYATALQLSREGALVAICSREQAHINAASDAIQAETRRPVLPLVGDVGKAADTTRIIERVVEEFGGLDILITNSGGPEPGKFETISDETWHEAIDMMLMSTVRLIRSALPQLRQSPAPSVLTITSISVKQPIDELVLSNSIRLAVIGLTKTLALELGSERIRFNSILPGWTDTERVQELLENRARRNSSTLEMEYSKQAGNSPFGRLATPQEFANVAAFLVSPAASYLSGVMLPVDGATYRGTF